MNQSTDNPFAEPIKTRQSSLGSKAVRALETAVRSAAKGAHAATTIGDRENMGRKVASVYDALPERGQVAPCASAGRWPTQVEGVGHLRRSGACQNERCCVAVRRRESADRHRDR